MASEATLAHPRTQIREQPPQGSPVQSGGLLLQRYANFQKNDMDDNDVPH